MMKLVKPRVVGMGGSSLLLEDIKKPRLHGVLVKPPTMRLKHWQISKD
jgi:hypothetical protein